MNIEYLNEFHQLMNYPSITQAAHTMGLSQPVLSRHIRALERELGAALLIRGSQQIEFTGAGKILLARLQELLPYWEQSRILVTNAAKNENKIVVGGILDNAKIKGRLFAASEVSQQDMRPLNIVFQEDAPVDALLEGRIDALVSYPLPPDDDLENRIGYVPMTQTSVCAVLMKDHRLANKSSLSLADLRKETVIRLMADNFSYDLWWNIFLTRCSQEGIQPQSRTVYVRDMRQTPTFFIGKDVYVCPTQGQQVGFWRANPLYVAVPVPEMSVDINIYFRTNDQSPALKQLLEILSSFGIDTI